MPDTPLVDVTIDTVDRTGFFCKMSARGKPGYERKLAWLKQRFAEGLEIKLLGAGERGFIEYIPGRYAWRAITGADDYLVIHCLWVVGKSKHKGFGLQLVDAAVEAARRGGYKGVAMVTSATNWVADGRFLTRCGFSIAARSGVYELMVRKLDEAAAVPAFSTDFDAKLAQMGPGVVVYRSDQCPYLDDAVNAVAAAASAMGLPLRIGHLASAEDVRRLAPTPYGVFAIAHDGRLVSSVYQLEKDLRRLLAA